MAITLIVKIRGSKLNNNWAFQEMVLNIAFETYYELEGK